jgi:nicotinamide mononucleotide transporter
MQPIEILEIAATLVTLACVILGVKRSLWQFPVGVIGTALFFIVVLDRKVYANAALQVFFLGVQFYGWWYWLKGAAGRRPPIGMTRPALLILGAALSGAATAALAVGLRSWTGSETPIVDGAIFSLSVFAQILLDRKRLETWPVWLVVNVLSVWLYYKLQLWVFLGLYVFFFFNAFWGWWEWRNAMRKQQPAAS